jgi:purine nucleosidase
MDKAKVLVDTDIGTDADDAVCLAYLLLNPACEVAAVTTVGRDAPDRARIVEVLCRHFGRPDVPIASGLDTPLFANRYWWHHRLNQLHVAERYGPTRTYARGRALDLMRRTIREHAGRIVLLALGPLSNMALLAAGDPDTAGMLREIVSIGGRFDCPPDAPQTDCNIMLDPTAAGAVFQRNVAPHRQVAVDTTAGDASFTSKEVDDCFASEHLRPVLECIRGWRPKGSGQVSLHDPFAAAVMLQPDLCAYERGRIGVKLYDYDLARGFRLEGDQVTGATHFTPDDSGPHHLARNGNVAAFKAHLREVLSGAS